MECLYCKKKLGLFASKRRPFCSEQHEVAYNDENAGLAMRRVMDPLFTEPTPKEQLASPPEAVAANRDEPEAESSDLMARILGEGPATRPPAELLRPAPPQARATPRSVPPPIPSEAWVPIAERLGLQSEQSPVAPRFAEELAADAPEPSFQVVPPPLQKAFPQAPPTAYPPEQDQGWAGFGVHEFEAEQGNGSIRLPEGPRLAQGLGEPLDAQPPEPPPDEPSAVEIATSNRLHPILEPEKPEGIAEGGEGRASQRETAPVEFPAPAARHVPWGLEPLPFQAGKAQPSAEAPEPPPAPPEAAGRLKVSALDPRPVEWQIPIRGEHGAALDAPGFAVRYPFADLPPAHAGLENGLAGSVSVPWAAAKLASGIGQPTLTGDAAPAPPRLIAPPEPLGPHLAAVKARLEPRESPAGAAGRWKVFSALREAPAKLRYPNRLEAPVTRVEPAAREPQPFYQAQPEGLAADVLRDAFEYATARNIETVLGEAPVKLHYPGWLDALATQVESAALEPQPFYQPQSSAAAAHAFEDAIGREVETLLPGWQEELHSSALSISAQGLPGWSALPPSIPVMLREDPRLLQQARPPAAPAANPSTLTVAARLNLARKPQPDRRKRYRPPQMVAESIGIHRVRAASLIQIREPQLETVQPPGQANSNLPVAGPSKPRWKGVVPARHVPPAGAAGPLRPALKNPAWAA